LSTERSGAVSGGALCIGSVTIPNPVVLAPMAGVTTRAFRVIAKELGCGLAVTEMASAEGLVRANRQTRHIIAVDPLEKPCSVQLFGSDPLVVAEAAALAVRSGADIVDINMGCPVPKVTRNGAGAALMKDPERAAAIVAAVVRAVDVPVTVKMRSAWSDSEGPTAVDVARAVASAGARAIAVHARPRNGGYDTPADWSMVAAVKESVYVPVIGNGDVRGPEDAGRMLRSTGCDGVMVGRAALGAPWLPGMIAAYLVHGEVQEPPAIEDRMGIALRHLAMLVDMRGPERAAREMRKHVGWYVRGLPGASRIRSAVQSLTTPAEIEQLLADYCEWLEQAADAR